MNLRNVSEISTKSFFGDTMKKIIGTLSCLILLTVIYFTIDYIRPYKIDVEYGGIIYSNETKFEKKTVINIHGDLYKSLFGRNAFNGELILDKEVKHNIKLYQEDNNYFGILTSIESEFKNIETIGSVLISNNFDRAWIQLDEINLKYDIVEGYISGPANTIDEAKNIPSIILEITK